MSNPLRVSLNRRSLLLGTGAAFALSGCGGNLIGPLPAPQLYLLKPEMGPLADAPQVSWTLEVALPSAPASINTDRIALSNAALTMDYYANAAWQDQLPPLLQNLLVEAFEASGKIGAVAKDSTEIHSDLLLQVDIRDFEAQYAVPDAAPKVMLRFETRLIRSREIAASFETVQQAQASANSVPSVVAAFNQALGAALAQIVAGTLRAGR